MSQTYFHYETATDVGRSFLDRLRIFPRQPDLLVYGVRAIAAATVRAWLRTYHRLQIRRRENLPRSGSFVMVANHCSHLDALCMLAALPWRQLNKAYPAAATDYFFVSLPRVAAAAIFVNAMPFDRQHQMRRSIDVCRRVLRDDGTVLILFPEGTRSSDGQMKQFRPGVGSLLAGLNVPVVPCAIVGANRALPKGSIVPRPFGLKLIIGESRNYRAMKPEKESARRISAELHAAVRGLLCE